MAQELAKAGATVVKFPNTVTHISEPMKEMGAAIANGRFHHDGNPVLTWMASNVVAKEDKKSNIFPNKEKKANNSARISMLATLSAIADSASGEL